jgi:hypothetical protein
VSAIHYRVVEAPSEEADSKLVSVVAERAGATFVVLAPQDNPCLGVLLERDLDGDGLTDALIENRTCGNCCPSMYLFVAGTTSERFEAQDLAAQWVPPELETWRGRSSVVLQTDNEGMNLAPPEKVTRRFVFESGRAVMVEEQRAVEEKALANLRAGQFANAKPDQEKVLSFDLDGDGKKDALAGTLWERWGRFHWQVRFADGRLSDGGSLACKRLGVLPSKTLGYRDLVCDFDTRIQWNGSSYQPPAR